MDRNDGLPEIDTLKLVALRKESVDRNTLSGVSMDCQKCRSPQGERG